MPGRPLRVAYVFRAPVGGLFRHVADLIRGLDELGHEAGIVCDSLTGGKQSEEALGALEAHCRLGIHRLPMPRLPGPGDLRAARAVAQVCRSLAPDLVHGHGAKGGVYARPAASGMGIGAVYTPHGGSLHYSWRSPQGAAFLLCERLLLSRTSGLVFVCAYERNSFREKVGDAHVPDRVVHNGLWPEEFDPVPPRADAADLLFIGELRLLKGVDILIEAMSMADTMGRRLTAAIVGDGPDRSRFEALAARHGLASRVSFLGAMPARRAFEAGRLLVVPSRAESFPYVVLEAVAAGLPVVASRVGGIPEMLPGDRLVEPADPRKLAEAILSAAAGTGGRTLRATFRERFSAARMAQEICGFYAELLASGNEKHQSGSVR